MADQIKDINEEPAAAVDQEEAAETQPADSAEASAPKPKARKKTRRAVPAGHVHVLATFNNTIITVTDSKGNVLTSASAGSSGFRGSKKGTAYAAQVAAEKAIGSAKQDYGLEKADVSVQGVGMGREAAIRTLINQKIQVEQIRDRTSVAHGGVRPRKPKRN